jgi:hypothetical protein
MGYIIIILLAIIVIKWTEHRFFRWEAVVRHLWKGVYIYSDQMASHMQQFKLTDFEKLSMEGMRAQIELRGKLINSILDFINTMEKQEDENTEEETFGYGRYNFDTILMLAKTNPRAFEKFK